MTGGGVTSGGPLAGLRVIDLPPTRVGAQVTQTLADFGAEVVWVEPPGGGALRSQSCFPCLARGKQSIVADPTSTNGVRTLREVAASADVVVETFRPGTSERLGVGYADLAETNPGSGDEPLTLALFNGGEADAGRLRPLP
jgi:crotonobetainyl-CoA:carnitine CoA-transferase CaiB-like acyl-CoA transferase